jgi:hypothetical protein
MRRIAALSGVVLLVAGIVLAVSAIPLRTTFLPNNGTGTGVSGDGLGVYDNGVQRVSTYFGTNGGNVVLVTYTSGRKLTFDFSPSSPAWQASGLPQHSQAEVDIFGVNYYGPFLSMGVGTTAQVQTSVQFKGGGGLTYELSYLALAAKRQSQTEWLITSDPIDIGGFPGFTASSQASLGVFRKKSRQTFGAVNMPIRFKVELK